ncbi:DUF2750 domain-containing protein [Salinimonas iocasae]|uniref:DUF2750 domain-containing protein n=1 Tax=Salinimonas iocasae TaxID=2572577 RepID=A0A5B7YD81_9ALTE|nr:DUF2750 domain-containing protein [Salinimonas iocasae]QCZ93223.1 DUF2750 domain-containing protein [Salinimonas iocasae]
MALDEHPLLGVSAALRLQETISGIKDNQKVWILKDADGCVMLSTEDEDGVPVWPDAGLALLWATEDWADCEPMAVTLEDWLKKWTPGLMQDELCIMVCPVPGEDGEVMEPDELAEKLM